MLQLGVFFYLARAAPCYLPLHLLCCLLTMHLELVYRVSASLPVMRGAVNKEGMVVAATYTDNDAEIDVASKSSVLGMGKAKSMNSKPSSATKVRQVSAPKDDAPKKDPSKMNDEELIDHLMEEQDQESAEKVK